MLNIEKYKNEMSKKYKEYQDDGFSKGYHEMIGAAIMATPFGEHVKGSMGFLFDDLLDWLCAECKEPLLTKEEHDYLEVVFKPFWQDIAYVKKRTDSYGEYLLIKFKKGRLFDESAYSPTWREGTFCKGMEVGETYTLEELGITYGSREEE